MKTFRTVLSLMVVFALISAFPLIPSHAAETPGYHLFSVTSTEETANANLQDEIMQEDSHFSSGKITGVDGMISSIVYVKPEHQIPNQDSSPYQDANPRQNDVTWTKLPEYLTPGQTLELTVEVYATSYYNGSNSSVYVSYSKDDTRYFDSYVEEIEVYDWHGAREFLKIPVSNGDEYFKVTVIGGCMNTETCFVTYLYILTPETTEPYVFVDSGARFSSISGQVEYREPGSDEWEFAKIETELGVGYRIKTAMESSCVISFKDMSTYKMKPETEIEIAKQRPDDSKIKLVAGKIWANIKRMTKDGKLEIETTQAVAGIKGTIFSVEATADKTILQVLEGSVEFTCLASGEKVTVESGQTASGDTKMSPVTEFDKNADKEHWDAVTGTAGTSSTTDAAESESDDSTSYLWLILAGAGLAVVLVIVILILVLKKKKSKKLSPPQPQNFITPQQQNFVTPQPPAAAYYPPSFCKHCGAETNAGVSFCEHCGNKVN